MGRRAGTEDGQSWVTTAVPVAACGVGTEDEERTTTDKTCSFDWRGHSSSHVGGTCAGGFRGDGGLLCAHARLCVSGRLLLSASSPSASGHRWSTCTRWSTRLSISSLARSEYWWSEPAGGGLSVCPACSLPDTHALILPQAGQAAVLSAGTGGGWGHQFRGPPGGGRPGEIYRVRGRCLLCTCQALLLSCVSPQFLSLDDLPDSRANVDLRNDLPPRVSPPPSVGLPLADGGVGRCPPIRFPTWSPWGLWLTHSWPPRRRSSSSLSCPWPLWPLMRWRRTLAPCTGTVLSLAEGNQIRGEGCLGRVSAVAVFLPAQLSGGGPGQPEGF